MDITLSTQLKYYLKLRRMSVNKLSKETRNQPKLSA